MRSKRLGDAIAKDPGDLADTLMFWALVSFALIAVAAFLRGVAVA